MVCAGQMPASTSLRHSSLLFIRIPLASLHDLSIWLVTDQPEEHDDATPLVPEAEEQAVLITVLFDGQLEGPPGMLRAGCRIAC